MNNRILKAFAPIVLASLLLQTPAAYALTGGPFDGGRSLGATASGTYSGVITGKNVLGLVQFGIDDGSRSGLAQESNGRFAVFHEGIMSYGVCEGIADVANQQLAGALMGVTALPGETTGASANLSSASAQQAITLRGSAEGFFTAEMKGVPIAITFEGEGELSTVANPATITGTADASVTITGAGTADNSATGSSDPSTISGDAAATIQPTALRATTPFEIRGSRTSLFPYSPINSFAAVPPEVPSTPGATPAPGSP